MDATGRWYSSSEVYDPKTGAFSPSGSMSVSRYMPHSALLPDGRVLIAGVDQAQTHSSAELYDPKSGSFVPTGSMTTWIWPDTTALRLADGRVLFWTETQRFETYDPVTGTFSDKDTPALVGPAVVLADGRVLFAGGDTMLPLEAGYLYRP
jgi:hypothetical protein